MVLVASLLKGAEGKEATLSTVRYCVLNNMLPLIQQNDV